MAMKFVEVLPGIGSSPTIKKLMKLWYTKGTVSMVGSPAAYTNTKPIVHSTMLPDSFYFSYHRKEVCKTSGTLANNLAPQTVKISQPHII